MADKKSGSKKLEVETSGLSWHQKSKINSEVKTPESISVPCSRPKVSSYGLQNISSILRHFKQLKLKYNVNVVVDKIVLHPAVVVK